MKPIYTLRSLYLLFSLCLTITACDKKEIDGGIAPFCFYITVQDATGNDLLNPEIEGNITKNDIKAIYREKTYPRIPIADNSSFFQTEKTSEGKYLLYLGLFLRGESNLETIVIDWADGSKDTISFDATQEDQIPLFLNGELVTDFAPSFHLKIIK